MRERHKKLRHKNTENELSWVAVIFFAKHVFIIISN